MPVPATGPRRHAAAFWSAVIAASLLLGGGVLVAALGYGATAGPDGAVRGYFAALARSDAPAALAFGDLPSGPHTLLTSTVLREQQRIAPMRQFSIKSTRRDGTRATVTIDYTLEFPGDRQQITDTVQVRETDGSWRLVRAAIPTQLEVVRAAQRATIVGAGIPEGTVLVFPGAVPIRLDTPYLELEAAEDSVSFTAGPTTQVSATVSEAGKKAVRSAVSVALRSCLDGSSRDRRCPQPTERCVPGSLRGALVGAIGDDLTVDLDQTATGTLDITGGVRVRVRGTYRKLTFRNRTVVGSGQLRLPIRASAYAVGPLQIVWAAGS